MSTGDRAPASQPEPTAATIVPSLARALLALVVERGHSPHRLCRGLGFAYADLYRADLLLSYQQTRLLILRAQDQLEEPAVGLATGARQTLLSWGLPGLAMQTCTTLGEAIAYGIGHQNDVGAMVDVAFEVDGREMGIVVTDRVFDSRIEKFLVEEAFGSVLSVMRQLVGRELAPLRADFAFRKHGPVEPYTRFLRCPVRFAAQRNRLSFDSRWLSARLPGHDPFTSAHVREQLNQLLPVPSGRHQLVESLLRRFRADIGKRPRQAALADLANVSERTLRRQLRGQGVSYQRMRDEALHEKARDLLLHTSLTIVDVALAVGYADVRAFRRAFKRWTGKLPAAFRKAS